MVIWLIGMSASGKTTIGKKLHDQLTISGERWIFLDGDTFRNILGEDLGHTVEDRRKNAYRVSRFCEFLSIQGVNVIACVLSIFHDNQMYNKENISDYKEVYIKVDFEELISRDNKELYKKALKGEIKDVVGVDIEFKPPYSPDIIIDNNEQNSNFKDIINKIVDELKINIEDRYMYTKNNLLLNPHKYQYSKFEGEKFFQKFIEDRNKTYEFLSKRLEKFKKYDFSIELMLVDNYKNDTNLILKKYLLYLLGSEKKVIDENEIIVTLLIKRFEVSKRLYTAYDLKEIRKSSQDFEELINYPLFSLVLQKYYKNKVNDEEKLIYLNSILKINDILSSIKNDIIIPVEIDTTLKAIASELEITKEYV